MRLEGKTAIVTGGAKGIGRSIVEAYVNEGARVAVVDLHLEGDSTTGPIGGTGVALCLEADVADPRQVVTMVDRVQKEFGRIDILVNNAGVHGQVFVEDMTVEEWDRVMSVNLRGVFLCTRFVLTHMLGQGSGRIINIASQLGQVGGSEMAHYSAAKGGVLVSCSRNELHIGSIPSPLVRLGMTPSRVWPT